MLLLTIVLKGDFSDEEGSGLTRQPGQRKGGQGSGQEQWLGQKPGSESTLGTFGEPEEILLLDDKSKVGERRGGTGSKEPSCGGPFPMGRSVGLI